MFESVTTPLKVEARVAANGLLVSIVVAVSTMAGLAFIGIAIFYASYKSFGGLIACLAESGFATVVVACTVFIILVSRSRARRRAVARAEQAEMEQRQKRSNAPPMWRALGVIGAALPVVAKAVGFGIGNKKAASGLAGSIVTGFALLKAFQRNARTPAAEKSRNV